MRPPEPRPWDPPRAEVPEAAPDEPEELVDRPLERARLCERWSNVGGPGDASVEGIGHAALARTPLRNVTLFSLPSIS